MDSLSDIHLAKDGCDFDFVTVIDLRIDGEIDFHGLDLSCSALVAFPEKSAGRVALISPLDVVVKVGFCVDMATGFEGETGLLGAGIVRS